jgi:hypothetical protein
MTTEMTTTSDDSQNGSKKPNFYAKVRQVSYGKKATHERIGAAWLSEDGSVYVKLAGTQIVDRGFTLYAVEEDDKAGA